MFRARGTAIFCHARLHNANESAVILFSRAAAAVVDVAVVVASAEVAVVGVVVAHTRSAAVFILARLLSL